MSQIVTAQCSTQARGVALTGRTTRTPMTNSSNARGQTGRAKSSSISKKSKRSADAPMLKDGDQWVTLMSTAATTSSSETRITTTSVKVTLDGELPDWPLRFILDFPSDERDWRSKAACAGVDPEIFYPTILPPDFRKAVEICSQCPVSGSCLDHALWYPELIGFWGGMSERGRRLYKRRLNAVKKREQKKLR